MSTLPPSFAAADLDTLLAEASLTCEHAVVGHVRGQWVPKTQRTHCDKIYVVIGGKGVARLNQFDYHVRAGDVFLLPAGTIQQGDTDDRDPLHKYWVHFQASTTGTLQLMSLFPPPLCLKGDSARAIGALTRELLREWQGRAPARQLAIKSLLMRVLLIAYRSPRGDIRPPDGMRKSALTVLTEEGEASRLPLDRIRATLAMMNRDYNRQLSLGDLAKCACLHPTYFNQVFKRVVGMPPMKFLEQQRLRRAQELLGHSVLPVADVALNVGYGDPYYFSRAFRRLTGLSPSAYREEVQKHSAPMRGNPGTKKVHQ
jgi:AraC family transcriptional regulator of arabinose operon